MATAPKNSQELEIEIEFDIENLSLKKLKEIKNVGNSFYKESSFENASQTYSKGLNLIEDLERELKAIKFLFLLNLAATSLNANDYPKTVIICTKILEVEPKNCKALWRRGVANSRLNNFKQAKTDLIAALAIEPNDPSILKELSEIESKNISNVIGGPHPTNPDLHVFPPLACQIIGEVPRLPYDDPRALALIADEKPVILTGSDVARIACEKWSFEYLAEMNIAKEFEVYISLANKFMYHEDKGFNSYHFKQPSEKVKMKFHEFFHKARVGNDGRFYYLQESLHTDVGKNVIEEVKTFKWDWVLSLAKSMTWSKLKSTVLWVGQKGVVTQGHFDEAHNLFAHLKGIKRFNLLCPDQFPCMYPYPYHHPGDRQCQVDFYQPDTIKFPKFIEAKSVTAELRPGDVLYLPPYWWHHVESCTETLGINFWFEMKPSSAADLVLPLSIQQMVAVRRNVEKFVGTLVPSPQLGNFFEELARSRYTPE
eukprot:TRINITY_DN430_c0_g1_i1.p1 TRINITY_DN430_c0_g1~~TRINITY_DN430_c0_g1_i1.p1  ORF type:complete len:483 (+),score=204.91 TRINITY_DN430_c0_g1_i1:901-2349(+)